MICSPKKPRRWRTTRPSLRPNRRGDRRQGSITPLSDACLATLRSKPPSVACASSIHSGFSPACTARLPDSGGLQRLARTCSQAEDIAMTVESMRTQAEVRHATRHTKVQPYRSVLCSTCCDIQHAPYNLQHATGNIPPARRNIHHTARTIHKTNMQRRHMPGALQLNQYAAVQSATYHLPHGMSHAAL